MGLENSKANNKGKLTYGAISNIVASKVATLTWLTKLWSSTISRS
jgi:hypothetical protein